MNVQRSNFRRWCLTMCAVVIVYTAPLCALAAPTADEVFKSMQQQTSTTTDSMDGSKVMGFLAAIAGVIVLIVAIHRVQQRRSEAPQTVNHQGKLVRELMKSAGLKSAQIRQLKALRDDLEERGESVDHLVTLLLCPSLIRKAREPAGEKPQSSLTQS